MTILLTCFKVYTLGYPTGQFTLELIIGGFYGFLCFGRITAGLKGNAVESTWYIIVMVIFSVISLTCNYYFMVRQTYM